MTATVREFRARGVPARERFEWWREALAGTDLPGHLSSRGTDDFEARMLLANFGAVQLTDASFPAMSLRRTPALIRRADPESYRLTLAAGGPVVGMTHGRSEVPLVEGEMLLFTSSRTYRAHVPGPGPGARLVSLYFPRGALPLAPGRVEKMLGEPIARSAMTDLVGGYLLSLARTATDPGIEAGDAARLGAVALDLVTALLAHQLGRGASVPEASRQQVLLMRVRAFAEQRLGDPELSPAMLAAAHHISVGYLHRLFRREGVTVGCWIRERRLECCRRELADPATVDLPVSRIATRWGFVHASDFSRAFRAAYGLPPATYRRSVLHGETLPPTR
ncbi:helix-turn-helix domain-containing protein [Streptomyces sp. NPDC090306]|uniref:helix-turn-helix domain-containing protein n=1 Tax=Streptomyces sp. NPDC090306 TaxID=3365961 RepID=UPI003825F0DC